MRAGQDDVVRPHMVLPLRPQPRAAPVGQTQPEFVRLFPRRTVSTLHRRQFSCPASQRRLVVAQSREAVSEVAAAHELVDHFWDHTAQHALARLIVARVCDHETLKVRVKALPKRR